MKKIILEAQPIPLTVQHKWMGHASKLLAELQHPNKYQIMTECTRAVCLNFWTEKLATTLHMNFNVNIQVNTYI